MHRTSLMLPEPLKARAERRSRQLGVSLGEFVRVSMEGELDRCERDEPDPLFADRAVHRGGAPAALSRDHDAWLYGEPQ